MLSGFIVMAFPAIAAISAAVYLPCFFYLSRSFGRKPFLFHLAKYTFIGYCISLIYLTLLWYPVITFQPEHYFLNLEPFIWAREVYVMGARRMAEQLILNIGMFIPFGLLLPLAVKRARKLWNTIAAVACSSLVIEAVQYFMGRSADIDDLIMNCAGGVLGYLLFAVLNRLFAGKKLWVNMLG